MHNPSPTLHLPPTTITNLLQELQNQHQLTNQILNLKTQNQQTTILWDTTHQLQLLPTPPNKPTKIQKILVVPGTSKPPHHTLEPQAIRRIQWINEHNPKYDLILLSGGPKPNIEPEAHQLLKHLTVTTPTILDVAANSTAANAIGAHRLQQILNPEAQIHSIASWSNALRQHLLFKKTANKHYTKTITLTGEHHNRDIKPGIQGLAHMKNHLHQAQYYYTTTKGEQ